MILKFLDKIISYFSYSEKFVRKARAQLDQINMLEEKFKQMSDDEMRLFGSKIRERISAGESIFSDSIINDSFALTREASWRTMGMRHFDVQLIGGLALHKGMVAEMKTGEGKTLTETLPAVLNAFSGDPVHIITVNDYLAKRDHDWMRKIYDFLGITSGVILSHLDKQSRKQAYNCDITYGTNNEFGFDYLRDNMEISLKDQVQRGLSYALIDEADSVLIDEARTSLIISGPGTKSGDNYVLANKIAIMLRSDQIEVDEKNHNVTIKDDAYDSISDFLTAQGKLLEGESLFDIHHIPLLHHINSSMKAHHLFKRDKDYIVRNGEVMIVDEFTGRVMDGRRYSDGLHQALEAKENVHIHDENQTIASTTFQNYFRLYKRISGMTGTAHTEREEFKQIYNLDVCCVPTNMPLIRKDEDDEIYRTIEEKYDAIILAIKDAHERKQPVLVGTVSIERSEAISDKLTKAGIVHKILNAKHHEQEAKIIECAGIPGAVTIATNMAGRGTDIKLGGCIDELLADNDIISLQKAQVLDAGGLYVIGTERHESRRIDNQLRGRSGRQGDPGRSKFFLSLEDDLMRIFGTNRASGILKTLGLKQGEAIIHPLISRAIARAQKKVELQNFEIRKNVLQYDNILSNHRGIIFNYRNIILNADSYEHIISLVKQTYNKANEKIVKRHIPGHNMNNFIDAPVFEKIKIDLKAIYNMDNFSQINEHLDKMAIHGSEALRIINDTVDKLFRDGFKQFIEFEQFNEANNNEDYSIEKRLWLNTIDDSWRTHLLSLDYLRHTVNMKALAQKDPLTEYTIESHKLLQELLEKIEIEFLTKLVHLKGFISSIDHTTDQIEGQMQS